MAAPSIIAIAGPHCKYPFSSTEEVFDDIPPNGSLRSTSVYIGEREKEPPERRKPGRDVAKPPRLLAK